MQVQSSSGEVVYNLTVGKTLPEWISEAKQRSLRKNEEFRSRIELIQDLYFANSCQRVKYSPDGEWLVATGTYPPTVKVYSLKDLSISFERRLDSLVTQFQVLSDDYSKMVFLRNDRYLEFHAKFGKYHTIRVPKAGRDMMYDYSSCDLIVAGAGSDIFRLNLESGTFLKPMTSSCSSINACGIDPQHGLYMFGGDDGIVEFWDPRSRKPISFLDAAAHVQKLTEGIVTERCEISAVRFNQQSGLTAAIGTSTGQCLIYDLRLSTPVYMRDHNYSTPITDIKFHTSSGYVISSCKKIVKVWSPETNQLFCSIEPSNMDTIEDIAVRDNSGMLFVAGEHKKINVFYIPGLGLAPSWCRFLDNFTEELENDVKKEEIYTDYKFVTREELQDLGFEKLIGTNYLRAYMHGYFIDVRLYNRMKSIANPDEYKEWRKEKIRQKMEEKRASRITIQRRVLPKVNRTFAEGLLNSSIRIKEDNKEDMLKGRFSALFSDPNFTIDPESSTFAFTKNKKNKKGGALADHYDNLEGFQEAEDNEEEEEGDVGSVSSSEEEQVAPAAPVDESEKLVQDLVDIRSAVKERKPVDPWKKKKPERKSKIRHYEARDDANALNPRGNKKQKLESAPFNKRIEVEKIKADKEKSTHVGFGVMSMTYTPQVDKEKREQQKVARMARKERNKDKRDMRSVDPIFRKKLR
uniref:Uncharacterized protein n=1 Tax=Arcella intermedia TaxID=1963864 RepID=A0A6B2KZ55_9EUKA